VWGVIFFVLNVDVAVIAAGLSEVRLRRLWVAAMVARFPWLVASAWFGEVVFVSDTVMYLALLGLIASVVVFQKLRPHFQRWLVARVARDAEARRRRASADTPRLPRHPAEEAAGVPPPRVEAARGGLGIIAGVGGRARRGGRRRGG
jgi:hypothetical protein